MLPHLVDFSKVLKRTCDKRFSQCSIPSKSQVKIVSYNYDWNDVLHIVKALGFGEEDIVVELTTKLCRAFVLHSIGQEPWSKADLSHLAVDGEDVCELWASVLTPRPDNKPPKSMGKIPEVMSSCIKTHQFALMRPQLGISSDLSQSYVAPLQFPYSICYQPLVETSNGKRTIDDNENAQRRYLARIDNMDVTCSMVVNTIRLQFKEGKRGYDTFVFPSSCLTTFSHGLHHSVWLSASKTYDRRQTNPHAPLIPNERCGVCVGPMARDKFILQIYTLVFVKVLVNAVAGDMFETMGRKVSASDWLRGFCSRVDSILFANSGYEEFIKVNLLYPMSRIKDGLVGEGIPNSWTTVEHLKALGAVEKKNSFRVLQKMTFKTPTTLKKDDSFNRKVQYEEIWTPEDIGKNVGDTYVGLGLFSLGLFVGQGNKLNARTLIGGAIVSCTSNDKLDIDESEEFVLDELTDQDELDVAALCDMIENSPASSPCPSVSSVKRNLELEFEFPGEEDDEELPSKRAKAE